MAIFPVSPSVGQEETVLGRTFVYDGYGWVAKDTSGHTFEDSAGNVLPARSVAKAGAGIEFEDDDVGKKTVIRVDEDLTNLVPSIQSLSSVLLFDKAHKVRKTTMTAPIVYSLAETGNKPISFIEDIVLGDGVNEVSIPETFINTNDGAFNNTKANALIFYYDIDGRVRYTIENLETVIGLIQLSTPANFQAVSGGATQINLSWDAVTNSTNYTLEVSDSGNSGTWTELTTTANLNYEHTGLTEGETKYYRLRANGDDVTYSNSAYTSTQSATTSSGATLTTPTLTVTTVDSVTNRSTWTNVSGEEGYQLQRSDNGVDGWVTLTTTLADIVTFDDATCVPEQPYFYRVKAIGNGTTVLDSAYSAVHSVITQSLLVSTLSFLSGDTQITVTIENLDPNVDSITLERDTNSDFSTAVFVEEYISPNSSVVDTGLVNETIYYYRIRAFFNSQLYQEIIKREQPGFPIPSAHHNITDSTIDLVAHSITDIVNDRDLIAASTGASPSLLSAQFNGKQAVNFPLYSSYKFSNFNCSHVDGFAQLLVTRYSSGGPLYANGINVNSVRNYVAMIGSTDIRGTAGASTTGIQTAHPPAKWIMSFLRFYNGTLYLYVFDLESNSVIIDSSLPISMTSIIEDFGIGDLNFNNDYITYSGVIDWQASMFFEKMVTDSQALYLINKIKTEYGTV